MVIDIKITVFIPLDPTIPFSHTVSQMRKFIACPRRFVAMLFIIAKDWQQPKYPSTRDWFLKKGEGGMILHPCNRILRSS